MNNETLKAIKEDNINNYFYLLANEYIINNNETYISRKDKKFSCSDIKEIGEIYALLKDEFNYTANDVVDYSLYIDDKKLSYVQAVKYDLYYSLIEEIKDLIKEVLKANNIKEGLIESIIENVEVVPYLYNQIDINSEFLRSSNIRYILHYENGKKELIKKKMSKFVKSKDFGDYLKNIEYQGY